MGTNVLASYTRQYSEIPLLQKACRVDYTLYGSGQELYLSVCAVPGSQPAVCALTGLDTGYARGLVQYLYENAVPAQQAQEVVQDLCAALCAAQ